MKMQTCPMTLNNPLLGAFYFLVRHLLSEDIYRGPVHYFLSLSIFNEGSEKGKLLTRITFSSICYMMESKNLKKKSIKIAWCQGHF